jgi:hypothetical protein
MTLPRAMYRGAAAALLALSAACATTVPRDVLQLPKEAAANRVLQTRRFDGIDAGRMLTAGTGVLQDLGFTIDEGETSLGLIVASKERTAVNDAEVAGAYLLTMLSIVALAPTAPVYAKRQQVRVSLMASPERSGNSTSTMLRVTFQRTVYDNYDRIRRLEQVGDEDLYQEFFDRLSQSVFLEAQSP